MDSIPVIVLSDDDEEACLAPRTEDNKKRRGRGKKAVRDETVPQEQPLGRRRQPARAIARGRAFSRTQPEVVVLDSPEVVGAITRSRLSQSGVSDREGPAGNQEQRKAKAKKVGGRGRGRPKKNKDACVSETLNSDDGSGEEALTHSRPDQLKSTSGEDVVHEVNSQLLGKAARPLNSQDLNSQDLPLVDTSRLGRKDLSVTSAAIEMAGSWKNDSELCAKRVKMTPAGISPGVVQRSIPAEGNSPPHASGASAVIEDGQQLQPSTKLQTLQGNADDDEEDEDLNLFNFGKNRAPPPRWEDTQPTASGDSGNLGLNSSKNACPTDRLKESDMSDSDCSEMPSPDTILGQQLLAAKVSSVLSKPATKSRGRSKKADQAGSRNRSKGAKAKTSRSNKKPSLASTLRAKLAEKDEACKAILKEVRQQEGNLKSVHATLLVANSQLAETNFTPPEKLKIPCGPSVDHDSTGDEEEKEHTSYDEGTKSPSSNVGGKVGEKILLKVASSTVEYVWKISKDDVLGKLFKAFSEKAGIELEKLRFSFDGEVLKPTDTPEDKELEEEDKIDVAILL